MNNYKNLETFKVYHALDSDKFEGTIWVSKREYGDRAVVKLRNASNGKSVFCESSFMDKNFLYKYNASPRTINITNRDVLESGTEQFPVIVLSAWYRKKLGIDLEKSRLVELSVVEKRVDIFSNIQLCLDSPQAVVRVTTIVALISLLLGVISLALATLDVRMFFGGSCFLAGYLFRLVTEAE